MKPTASPRHWPYREHRNMAQVMADERGYQAAIARDCPHCGAVPGVRCKTLNGGQYDSLHTARRIG